VVDATGFNQLTAAQAWRPVRVIMRMNPSTTDPLRAAFYGELVTFDDSVVTVSGVVNSATTRGNELHLGFTQRPTGTGLTQLKQSPGTPYRPARVVISVVNTEG
jgi:hypothetical protein